MVLQPHPTINNVRAINAVGVVFHVPVKSGTLIAHNIMA